MRKGMPVGVVVQLWVGDGRRARQWYERLFGAPPSLQPHGDDSFIEWHFEGGRWEIHVAEKQPAGVQQARVRFGVDDIVAERQALIDAGVAVGEIEEIEGLVRWVNFDDPWGNKLGLYVDVARFG